MDENQKQKEAMLDKDNTNIQGRGESVVSNDAEVNKKLYKADHPETLDNHEENYGDERYQ